VAPDGGGTRTGFPCAAFPILQLSTPFVSFACFCSQAPVPIPHHSITPPLQFPRIMRYSTHLVYFMIPALNHDLFLRHLSLFEAGRLKCLSMNNLHIKMSFLVQAPSSPVKPNQGVSLNHNACHSINQILYQASMVFRFREPKPSRYFRFNQIKPMPCSRLPFPRIRRPCAGAAASGRLHRRLQRLSQLCRSGEMADAQDLKSWASKMACGFESRLRHQKKAIKINFFQQ
jgi:hypothetical protein